MLQKSTLQKKSRNSKLKEKYYINKKAHLATKTIFVPHHSLKINKQGVLISYCGAAKKSENKRPPPRLLGT